jgi:hypothetical protein
MCACDRRGFRRRSGCADVCVMTLMVCDDSDEGQDGTQKRLPRGVLVPTHFCLLVNRTRPLLQKNCKKFFFGHRPHKTNSFSRHATLAVLERKNVPPTNAKARHHRLMNLEYPVPNWFTLLNMPTCHNSCAHLLRTCHDHAPQHQNQCAVLPHALLQNPTHPNTQHTQHTQHTHTTHTR